jgi:hypothetical protein
MEDCRGVHELVALGVLFVLLFAFLQLFASSSEKNDLALAYLSLSFAKGKDLLQEKMCVFLFTTFGHKDRR